MRTLRSILLLGIVVFAATWIVGGGKNIQDFAGRYLGTGEFLTLEARYSAEDLMEAQREKLLPNEGYQFLKPSLQYYPLLLMDIKYSRGDKSTEEAELLWSLTDGEMVIDTGNWETSHGFADCIQADANSNDYRIIRSLAKHGGNMEKEALARSLGLEGDVLDIWLESAKDKYLIVQHGNRFRLHFEKPKLLLKPSTRIAQRLVTKPYKFSQSANAQFSRGQIENNSQAAFGKDFAIRNHRQVYLPVHVIRVKNPDGSVLTSYWNALTGHSIEEPLR